MDQSEGQSSGGLRVSRDAKLSSGLTLKSLGEKTDRRSHVVNVINNNIKINNNNVNFNSNGMILCGALGLPPFEKG